MRVDTNTQGHRQWFYFSMKNQSKCTVVLRIYRFKKIYSLFQRGMRPYVCSRKSGSVWQPGGSQVRYYEEKPYFPTYINQNSPKSFVLSFRYTFHHFNDEVLICAGIPYSYTHLGKQLNLYQSQSQHHNLSFQVATLTKSMCGLDVPLISVYHPMARLANDKKKKFIIINARSHSGQASASWVLDGFIKELSNAPHQIQSWLFSQNLQFRIVPMLNPDGVILGNYRTGIMGDDFNRQFDSSRPQFYPEIGALKRLVAACKKEGEVELFLDLHGHSVLKNSFIYGPAEVEFQRHRMKNLAVHLFHSSKYFRLASCKFEAAKGKIQTKNLSEKKGKSSTDHSRSTYQTARGYFQFQEELLSFTCQNSLGLYYSQNQTLQLLAQDWQQFGKSMLHSMKASCSREVQSLLGESSLSGKLRKQERGTLQSSQSISTQVQKKLGKEIKCQIEKATKTKRVYLQLSGLTTPLQNEKEKEKEDRPSKLCSQTLERESPARRKDDSLDLNSPDNRGRTVDLNEAKIKFNKIRNTRQSKEFSIRKISGNQKGSDSIQLGVSLGKPLLRENSEKQAKSQLMLLQRSSTCDNATLMLRQLAARKDSQPEADMESPSEPQNYSKYQLQAVKETFSDSYQSINDSDSSGDDLPEQQKNYLLEYIRLNQKQVQGSAEEGADNKQRRTLTKDFQEPKISKFRQIRFKSREDGNEDNECQEQKEWWKSQSKKIKLEPHKFKNPTNKSLLSNETLGQEFEDPSMLPISQQKILNERVGYSRRAQKDPFVLIHRKQRARKRDLK